MRFHGTGAVQSSHGSHFHIRFIQKLLQSRGQFLWVGTQNVNRVCAQASYRRQQCKGRAGRRQASSLSQSRSLVPSPLESAYKACTGAGPGQSVTTGVSQPYARLPQKVRTTGGEGRFRHMGTFADRDLKDRACTLDLMTSHPIVVAVDLVFTTLETIVGTSTWNDHPEHLSANSRTLGHRHISTAGYLRRTGAELDPEPWGISRSNASPADRSGRRVFGRCCSLSHHHPHLERPDGVRHARLARAGQRRTGNELDLVLPGLSGFLGLARQAKFILF